MFSFPFGVEGGMLDLIALVPDHCLSFYFGALKLFSSTKRPLLMPVTDDFPS